MAFLERLKRKKAEFHKARAQQRAFHTQLAKKEQAAYNKSYEKAKLTEARKRAAHKAKPLSQRLTQGASVGVKGLKKATSGLKAHRANVAKSQSSTPQLFGGPANTDFLYGKKKK